MCPPNRSSDFAFSCCPDTGFLFSLVAGKLVSAGGEGAGISLPALARRTRQPEEPLLRVASVPHRCLLQLLDQTAVYTPGYVSFAWQLGWFAKGGT